MTHNATAKRRPTGWIRWYASCVGCGWGINGTSREDAEQRAERHNVEQGASVGGVA